MVTTIAKRAVYPRQVETFLDGLEEHVEDVSREFKAVVEINGKTYFVEVRELHLPPAGAVDIQYVIDHHELTDYR